MSQALLSIQCDTASIANAYKAEADAGELWGVSLGTTTSAQAVGTVLVVRCTHNRASALFGASPENTATWGNAPTPSDMSEDQAALYGLGLMDSA